MAKLLSLMSGGEVKLFDPADFCSAGCRSIFAIEIKL